MVGKTSIFDIEKEFVFASYLIRLKTSPELNPHFLNNYFNLTETQKRLKSIASRGVSQSNISATRLKTFRIPFPKDLKEQEDINEVIQQVDNKISIVSQRIEKLQELFKTLLHQLMTAQIRVHELDFEDWESGENNKEQNTLQYEQLSFF